MRVLFAAAQIVTGSVILLAIGLRNPRLMLRDYPKDVQARVPPQTPGERREAIVWAVPLMLVLLGWPLLSTIVLARRSPGLSFARAFANASGTLVAFNVFDWLVLDWLIVCTITPRFIVLPGTEGMAGYKNYAMHFRGFLIGLGLSAVAGLVIAGIVQLV